MLPQASRMTAGQWMLRDQPWTKLPPAAAAGIAIPDDLQPRAKPEGMTFWVKAARDQGLIKGNPDPASLIAP